MKTKLTGKEDNIRKLLDKKVAVSAIIRILAVNRLDRQEFIKTRNLGSLSPEN